MANIKNHRILNYTPVTSLDPTDTIFVAALGGSTKLSSASFKAQVKAAIGGPVVLPLRAVGMRGESSKSSVVSTTADCKMFARIRNYIATDCTEIRLLVAGYWLDIDGDTNLGNDRTEAWAIEINGVTKQITWDSGATFKVIVDGIAYVYSDPLVPADFGISGNFIKGTLAWTRGVQEVTAGQNLLVHKPEQYATSNQIIGEQYLQGPAGTSANLLGTGVITATGGWSIATKMFMPINIIGRPVSDRELFQLVFGASGEDGVDESGGDGRLDNGPTGDRSGGGAYRRALSQTMTPRIMAAKGSQSARGWLVANSKSLQLVQFAPDVDHGHVGNDYTENPSLPVATALARVRQIDTVLKAAGARSIVSIAAITKNNRVDSGVGWTRTNLTPRPGFATGGAFRDPYNAARLADANNGVINGFLNFERAYVNNDYRDLFKDNYTQDGTHNLAAGHIAISALIIEYMNQKRASIKANQTFVVPTWPLIPSVAIAPTVTTNPTITGTAQVGSTLTATAGTYTGTPVPTVTRQWKRNGTSISGATSGSYLCTVDDLGFTITYVENVTNGTAPDAIGSSAATSTVIAAPAQGSDEAETTALLTAMTVQPSANRKTAINTLIKNLKDNGIWAKLDLFQVYNSHDAQAALLNWKNTAKYLAVTPSGGTFTALSGITTTATAWIDTGFNPATAAGAYVQDSACFGIGIATLGATGTSSLAGYFDGTKGTAIAPATPSNMTYRINQTAVATVTNSNGNGGNGVFAVDRSSASNSIGISNGTALAAQTTASSTITSGNFRVGSITGTTGQIRNFDLCYAGASLTAAQHALLNTAFTAFKAAAT